MLCGNCFSHNFWAQKKHNIIFKGLVRDSGSKHKLNWALGAI